MHKSSTEVARNQTVKWIRLWSLGKHSCEMHWNNPWESKRLAMPRGMIISTVGSSYQYGDQTLNSLILPLFQTWARFWFIATRGRNELVRCSYWGARVRRYHVVGRLREQWSIELSFIVWQFHLLFVFFSMLMNHILNNDQIERMVINCTKGENISIHHHLNQICTTDTNNSNKE